jgi:hypothetical protein
MGTTSGRIADVGLLDVSLEDDEGSITRVPHLLALIRPVQMQGPAPRVSIRVTVDRLRATSALRARLSRKIVAVGAEPRVEVEEVGRDDVIMSLSVLSEDLDAKSRLHLLALDVLDNPETSSLPPAGLPPRRQSHEPDLLTGPGARTSAPCCRAPLDAWPGLPGHRVLLLGLLIGPHFMGSSSAGLASFGRLTSALAWLAFIIGAHYGWVWAFALFRSMLLGIASRLAALFAGVARSGCALGRPRGGSCCCLGVGAVAPG